MNEIIDLDRNNEVGFFWKFFAKINNKSEFTFKDYIDSLHNDVPTILHIRYKNYLYRLHVYKLKWREDIKIYWGDCVAYIT